MSFLTVQEVREKVELCRSVASDPEAAHSAEDLIHSSVLVAIAYDEKMTLESARALAHEALQTMKIEFKRWRA